MFKIFSFIMLVLFCNSVQLAVFAGEVKFIHITDTNVTPNNAYKLQETIKEINSYKDIDFVVFGGNNIQKANIDNLNYFLYLIKKVNKKTYVLLGNQDVLSTSGLKKEYYMKKVRRKLSYRHSAKPNYVFEAKGYVFAVMDGSKQYFQSSNGYYTKAELMWLERVLKKYKNKTVIILQHFPLIENKSKWLETPKTEEYTELLNKYKNVKVIVSGHYGNNEEIQKDGIYHIITESYSKSGAYKIIQLDLENNFIGTYLVK